jgi:hypothetical protein
MVLDLSDGEAAALVQLLRRTINDDPYPLSPRLVLLKAILAKLDPRQGDAGAADEALSRAADGPRQRSGRPAGIERRDDGFPSSATARETGIDSLQIDIRSFGKEHLHYVDVAVPGR